MHFLLKRMGWVAKSSASLSRESVNGLPTNWLVIIVAAIAGFGGVGVLSEGTWWGLPLLLVGIPVCLAYLVSFFKRDTFFLPGEASPPAPARPEAALFETGLGFTGRLRLHEKEAQRFLDVPSRATRLEGGAFAFVSSIDASTRFSGVVTKSKVGLWVSVPRFEATQIECGTLFYGNTPRAALRLNFIETSDAKNRRVKVILSFDSPLERDAMRDFLVAQGQSAALPVVASPFSNTPIR